MTQIVKSSVKKQAGFSLIELLITLAISAILFAFALPGFQETIQNNRITTQINTFMSDLKLARSEAIKRSTRVTLCKSSDELSCSASGNWEQGWIVFVDDVTENANKDATELLLRSHKALGGNSTFIGVGDIDSYISYVSGGFSRTTGGARQTGSLALCDDRNDDEQARAIRINATGRPLLSSVNESPQSCP